MRVGVRVPVMDAVLSWLTAVGALVAAVASVATWWRTHGGVEWEVEPVDGGGRRYRVVNRGGRPAREVHLRVGSASDPADVDEEKSLPVVRPGEGLTCSDLASYGCADDYAFNVTWRPGWPGRRRSWSYRLL